MKLLGSALFVYLIFHERKIPRRFEAGFAACFFVEGRFQVPFEMFPHHAMEGFADGLFNDRRSVS